MADIGRYTTPTHIFRLSVDPHTITRASLVYEQAGKLVLEKRLADMTVGDDSLAVTLSEQETALFSASYNVDIQLRIGIGSARMNSRVLTVSVADVLKEEALDDA